MLGLEGEDDLLFETKINHLLQGCILTGK